VSFGGEIGRVSILKPVRAWFLCVGLAVSLLAAYNAQTYWAIRQKQYKKLGQSKLVTASVTALLQLGIGVIDGPSVGALICGLLAGQGAGMLFLAIGSGIPISLAGRLGELFRLARKYAHFPKYSALGSGLDGVSQLLPVALIVTAYGSSVGGQYALADRAMRMPSVLLGSSLAQVFFQRLAVSRGNPSECHRLLRRTWTHMALVGLLPTTIVMAIGPWLFAAVFGTGWYEAGRTARALAPGLFAYFVAFPTSNCIVAFERLGLLLAWQAGYVALVWALFRLGPRTFHLSPMALVWAFSAVLVVMYSLSLLLQWNVVETAKQDISPSSVRSVSSLIES
jgi:O-antigen/teichoic acid export membrane protein